MRPGHAQCSVGFHESGQRKPESSQAAGPPALHDEGVADEVAGRTQDASGRVRRKVGEAIEEVGNALKK